MNHISTDTLLSQAEYALARRDLASLLPFASELERRVTSPEAGQAVYDFFTRLTGEVICCPEPHIRLFACCLDAVCAYDPCEGAEFLERMLTLTDGIHTAVSAPQGVIH